jgi:small subunit ribosomal protein S17
VAEEADAPEVVPVAEEPVVEEPVEETPAEEPVLEETPVEETPTDEPVAEEVPAEEPAAEEEPVAEGAQSDERVAEVSDEGAAAEAPAEEAPADVVAVSEGSPEGETERAAAVVAPKPKKKRLPRAERRQRTKPKRERPAQRKPITRLPKPEHARGQRKERRGVVVSAAMDKTIVVRVETAKPHPVYKKIVRRSHKFHAHDEANVAKAGDVVRIVETRPISKTKTWRLAQVLEEAK